MARPAAEIEPVSRISSSSLILPGPTERAGSKSMRRVSLVMGSECDTGCRGGPAPEMGRRKSGKSERGRYRFDLRIVMQHCLAHLAAPAGLFVTAEGQCGIEHIMAVDP